MEWNAWNINWSLSFSFNSVIHHLFIHRPPETCCFPLSWLAGQDFSQKDHSVPHKPPTKWPRLVAAQLGKPVHTTPKNLHKHWITDKKSQMWLYLWGKSIISNYKTQDWTINSLCGFTLLPFHCYRHQFNWALTLWRAEENVDPWIHRRK